MNKPTFDEMPALLVSQGQEIRELKQLLVQHLGKQSVEKDHWFNLEEFCAYHPDHPKKPTVYSWVGKGEVPFHKTEGKKPLRFLKSEIDQWLLTGKNNMVKEIDNQAEEYLRKQKGGKL